MKISDLDKYLALLDRIYPGPRQMVETAWDTSRLLSCRLYSDEGNRGIACLVGLPDLNVGFLSFERDATDQALHDLARDLGPFFPRDGSSELCFNMYGRNPAAIQCVQSLGFKLEMWGLKLEYSPSVPLEAPPLALERRGLDRRDLGHFVTLFDRAYYDIDHISGSPVNAWARDPQGLWDKLSLFEASGGLNAFWQGETLVGVCLVRNESYINDLAVNPDYQRRGYGRAILADVINRMLQKGRQAQLDVAMANLRAQRFYARCHLVEIGCFADHTFAPLTCHSPLS